MKLKPRRWPPLVKADPEAVADLARALPANLNVESVYQNGLYVILIYFPRPNPWGPGNVTHIAIRNREGSTARPWSDYQRIKTELFGPERLALELYPPASQLLDEANLYHLWIFDDGAELPEVFNLLKNWFM